MVVEELAKQRCLEPRVHVQGPATKVVFSIINDQDSIPFPQVPPVSTCTITGSEVLEQSTNIIARGVRATVGALFRAIAQNHSASIAYSLNDPADIQSASCYTKRDMLVCQILPDCETIRPHCPGAERELSCMNALAGVSACAIQIGCHNFIEETNSEDLHLRDICFALPPSVRPPRNDDGSPSVSR